MSEERATERPSVDLPLTADELVLVRTALRLLLSTLGREEADELRQVQQLLTRIDDARR